MLNHNTKIVPPMVVKSSQEWLNDVHLASKPSLKVRSPYSAGEPDNREPHLQAVETSYLPDQTTSNPTKTINCSIKVRLAVKPTPARAVINPTKLCQTKPNQAIPYQTKPNQSIGGWSSRAHQTSKPTLGLRQTTPN